MLQRQDQRRILQAQLPQRAQKKINRAAPQKAWIAQRAKECGLEHLLTVEEQSKADSSAPAGSSVQADNSALAGAPR